MNNKYINFYNTLVNLTRNKILYKNFINQDTFSDRLIIFLFHFAFFLNIFNSNNQKKVLQDIFDYIFRQIEISIREIGYGDVSINKKMKSYINIFYSILNNINDWDSLDENNKCKIINDYLKLDNKPLIIVNYFDNYRHSLKNNTFNSVIKGVIKHNF